MIHEFHKQKDIRGLVEMELNRFSLDRELHVLRFGAHNNREDKVAQESGPSEWVVASGKGAAPMVKSLFVEKEWVGVDRTCMEAYSKVLCLLFLARKKCYSMLGFYTWLSTKYSKKD